MTQILLVDDSPELHELVHLYLKDVNGQIIDAFNSEEALCALGVKGEPSVAARPDVILLDIEMPGTNGFDLCRQIRSRQEFKKTPIIFITHHDEDEFRARAMDVGGTGYITKPFAKKVVTSTVQNAVNAKMLSDNTDVLIEHRSGLTNMLVHDINNQLATILLTMDLALLDSDVQKIHRRLNTIKKGMLEIKKLTSGLLDIEKLESKTLPLHIDKVDGWRMAFERASLVFNPEEKAHLKLRMFRPTAPAIVSCDQTVLQRVFDNLFQNAAKFAPEGSVVDIAAYASNGFWNFSIENEGPAIDESLHEKVFEKFGQLESRKVLSQKGVGLGLTYCRLAIEAMGGQIWIESPAKGQGALATGVRFVFSLPGTA